MNANQRGYNYSWQKYRIVFLKNNPLCVFCKDRGEVVAANVVDHIEPHKGNKVLFWDIDNHQALCDTCHSSTKQRMERGNLKQTGVDGWSS